jgi:L-ascorbate metabolism protein UlaG (beta-lactamase superfamily)
MGPEQSVAAHLQLKGKTYLPIHWGTFDLALHVWTEPIERALVAAEKNEVDYISPRIGQTVNIPREDENESWWPRDIEWSNVDETPIVSPNLGSTTKT